MNWGNITLWGFAATVVLTGLMMTAQRVGLSRMSIPFLVGTIFTPDRRHAQLLGAMAHMANGWLFALLYGAFFQSLGRASILIGAIFGLVQGLFVLTTVMPLMPSLNRRMATEHQGPALQKRIQPPGFMALNYGRSTPVATLIAHIVYGAILGAFYHVI